MSLVMEEQSQPVFRDFLGSSGPPQNPDSKQPELSATDSVRVSQNSGFMEEDGEASVRGGSTFSAPCPSAPAPAQNFPASSDPGIEMWRHSKTGMQIAHATKSPDENLRKRNEFSRGAYRESSHEQAEGSRPNKASRFKQREETNTGDLLLTMQPPRTAGNLWLQTSVYKTDPTAGTSKRVDASTRPTTTGVPMLGRPSQGNMQGLRENMVQLPRNTLQAPPADEGSRTGLQGGGIAALINSSNAKPPARPVGDASVLERSASLERPKLPLHTAGGSDSLLPSHKPSTSSATRQLTIFYGGHAHVFDDVSPDKADAIMQLAGSNGRSWSTTYAHRSSRSEGSLTDMERRRDKAINGSSSLGIPSDMQNVLQGVQRKHRFPPDHNAKLPGDVQVPAGVVIGDANRFALANGRAATGLHGSFYNMKEPTSNGQHWL